LIFASTVAGLALLEAGCRVAKNPRALLQWVNEPRNTISDLIADQKGWTVYDPILGFAPRPGGVSEYGSFDSHGFRIDPPARPDSPGVILATGGSFTVGDEVSERETWPAVLQDTTGFDVVNAGVSGYGLDQVVLRTERLAVMLAPAAVIVGFTPDNIWRNEMSRLWAAEKPYFSVDDDGKLDLHNVPVPPTPPPGLLQRMFGWSALVAFVLRRVGPDDPNDPNMGWHDEWLTGSVRALPRGDGRAISCALMHRLAGLGVPVLVVAQYERSTWERDAAYRTEQRRQSGMVLGCAREAGLATQDTFDAVDQAVRRSGVKSLYVNDHHSALGNRLVARSIGQALAVSGLPDRRGRSVRYSP
jgi:hypothetical protein